MTAAREPLEDLSSIVSPQPSIELRGALAQLLDGPVVAGHADDRAVQQLARLEAIERVEGHHLREIAGDAEDHEPVGERLPPPAAWPGAVFCVLAM